MIDKEKRNGVRVKLIDRKQMVLHAVDVDGLVGEDHEARAIWEFVGRLDLSGYYGKIGAVEGEAGQSAFDPRMLISLWIYAYSKGVSSAREVSRLCGYDPAYQWLTGLRSINYHTLSDFRVEHKEELDDLFTNVLGLLSAEGLITLERVMHDGTKVKASAGSDTFRREERIQGYLDMAREQIEVMGDPCCDGVSKRIASAKERALNERRERLDQALKELEKIRETKSGKERKEKVRVSTTDPEARIMKQGDGGYVPSYNVQISTDAAKGIIVGVDVSQSSDDYNELVSAVEQVEENMERKPAQMVVDGGFVSRENIIEMSERGVDFIAPAQGGVSQSAGQLKRRGVDIGFYPEAFRYDVNSDTYLCPAGKILVYEGKERRIGCTKYRYRVKGSDCLDCEFKQKCCPQSTTKGRAIVRGEDEPVVVAFNAKMETEEAKDIYRQRGSVAEFTIMWIKTKTGLRQFCVRGVNKVRMECIWACLSYNIKQWIRLSWRPQLEMG